MKTQQLRLASVLGAGVLMLGIPAVAIAQVESLTETPVTDTETPATDTLRGGSNVQEGQATFGNLIAALNNINAQINNLEVLNNLTVDRVRVVSADNLLQGSNIQALNNAINRNNVEILNLRNVLNENQIIQDALNQNDVAVNDVIAINVLSGGDVIVFYR